VTGALGSRVAADSPNMVSATPRRPQPGPYARAVGGRARGPAAYDDASAMRTALQGASTWCWSRAIARASAEEHATAVEAAIAAGVDRVLYVSRSARRPSPPTSTPRQWLTEQFLVGTGIRHTVLRAGTTPRHRPPRRQDFVVRGPAATAALPSSPTTTSPP